MPVVADPTSAISVFNVPEVRILPLEAKLIMAKAVARRTVLQQAADFISF